MHRNDGSHTGEAPTRREMLALLMAAPLRGDVRERMQMVMGELRLANGAPRYEVVEERRENGVVSRRIRYEAEAGDMTPAWLQTPEQVRGRRPAMVCLHQTTKIGKDEPAGFGGLRNLHYARELALRGWVTLSPDYPNFGESSFDAYAHGYASATMKGIVNHMRAVSLLESLPQVERRRIGAVGHSLGGHNALFLAVFDERVKAVATSCGFTSFAKYYGGDLKGWSHKGYMPRIASEYGCDPKRMPFDFPDVLRAVAPRALFINAPLRDDNFDASGVDDCVAVARPLYKRSERLRVEHPDCGHDFPPEVRQRAWAFLERAL